ncbi:amidohydrolase family protein, partial [Deinococcus sp. 6YEL10]|uniref:amidohydrolase family protein n=1 Tax=Deinococcus sp. 6YEL10 TaxID=2745870 RepID=UPI001E5B0C2A
GIPLPEAARMASLTPARSIGLHDRGELRPGLRADLVTLDPELTVQAVHVAGVPIAGTPVAGTPIAGTPTLENP